MAITQCTADTSAVSNLPDAPSLTPTELKATFDKGGTEIKNYINNTMIGDITSTISSTASTINATINSKDTQYNTRMTTIEGNVSTLSGTVSTLSSTVSGLSTSVSNLTTTVNGKQKTITSGTAAPSGGSNGDIYIQYFN